MIRPGISSSNSYHFIAEQTLLWQELVTGKHQLSAKPFRDEFSKAAWAQIPLCGESKK